MKAKPSSHFRFGVRFLARQEANKTLTVINPRLLPTPLPSFGIVGLSGRSAWAVFAQEMRHGRNQGETLNAVLAYYQNDSAEAPLNGRVAFERDDYPARTWLDLRYMRRSLSDVVLPLLNIPASSGSALTRAAASDLRLAMSLSPMNVERSLSALNKALGVSLDMIVMPFFPAAARSGDKNRSEEPWAGGSSPPACVWVINPQCLSPMEAEDGLFVVNPLARG